MGRRSVRRYLPQPVDAAALDRILLAATSAPSAHNRQPWRFAVIERLSVKTALARAMGARLSEDRLRRGDDPEVVAADVARSAARLTEAPAFVVFSLTMREMDVYHDAGQTRAEYLMAAQSVAMAMQNALLAACAEGLGACVMCAPLFCPDVVRETLRLPVDWEPQALITLGVAANAGRERGRKPLREVMLRIDALPERCEGGAP